VALAGHPVWAGIAVSPLKQEVRVNRGRTESFYIKVANHVREGKGATVPVQIEVVDFSVSREGVLTFHKADTEKYSASNWVKISDTSFSLKPGDGKKITCEISVPWTARGEYYSAIIVTPGLRKNLREGLTVQCRVASGVFVTVPGRLYPKKARVTECSVSVPSAGAEKPELTVTATIANKGRVLFVAEGEAKIRDKAGRLWARFPLKSRRNHVLPGDLRDFSGSLSRPLAAGEYVAEVVFDYGSKWKKARAKTPFSLSPIQADAWRQTAKPDDSAAIVIEPAQIEQTVAPGSFRRFTLRVSNIKSFPLAITARVVEPGEQGTGLGKWIGIAPAVFDLAEKEKRNIVFTMQAPKDAKGEQKGEIQFTLRNANGIKPAEGLIKVPLSINIK